MSDSRKIFNDMGFLTREGEAFVDDRFSKEMKKIFSTASYSQDIMVIASILKSMIDNHASKQHFSYNKTTIDSNISKSNLIDIKTENSIDILNKLNQL